MVVTFTTLLIGVTAALFGVVVASFLSLVPTLHVYNVAGLVLLLALNNSTIVPQTLALLWLWAMPC